MQETPSKICVNGAKMRTTSSIEAYNCQLNKVITNHSNFFTFIHDLRGEEYLKSEEMEQFILSGSATAKKRRAEYIVSVLFCLCIHIHITPFGSFVYLLFLFLFSLS